MRFFSKYARSIVLLGGLLFTSCSDSQIEVPQPEQEEEVPKPEEGKPLPEPFPGEQAYTSEAEAQRDLAGMYASFYANGLVEDPSNNNSLEGYDAGHSQYWRAYWILQELPTDEAVNGWGDSGLPDISRTTWGANNPFIKSYYARAYREIARANEFIRKLRKASKDGWSEANVFLAEARFIRSMVYWHVLDLFGNRVPLITDKTPLGEELRPASVNINGPEVFNYIASELKDIIAEGTGEKLLPTATTSVFTANKGAAKMLLSKLYLNHAVYLGTVNSDYYKDGLRLLEEMSPYYSIVDTKLSRDQYSPYQRLFLADNHTASSEMILLLGKPVGQAITYGGMTYILSAALSGDMNQPDHANPDPNTYDFGVSGGWAGNRSTPELVSKFILDKDQRALFWSKNRTFSIENLGNFMEGYSVTKYRNRTRSGGYASNYGSYSMHTDIDIPLFRLADAYLMMAEFEIRLYGSVTARTLSYLNQLQGRAGLPNISVSAVTLQWLLDERARELYWEGHRRTDLIRFGKYTGGAYLWAFKGGVATGMSVAGHYVRMPIPNAILQKHPKLIQNTGY